MVKPVEDLTVDKNPNNKKEVNINTMLMITTGIILIVVVICMLIMYLLLENSMDKKISKISPEGQEQVEEEGDEEEETDTTKQEGFLLDLGDFILNLADANARRYIKVSVALELTKTPEEIEAENAANEKGAEKKEGAAPADPNAAIAAEMERYKPAIRDAIITLLSNKSSDELSTSVGKELAKDEISDAVNGIFDNHRKVTRVSFGQFIIQ